MNAEKRLEREGRMEGQGAGPSVRERGFVREEERLSRALEFELYLFCNYLFTFFFFFFLSYFLSCVYFHYSLVFLNIFPYLFHILLFSTSPPSLLPFSPPPFHCSDESILQCILLGSALYRPGRDWIRTPRLWNNQARNEMEASQRMHFRLCLSITLCIELDGWMRLRLLINYVHRKDEPALPVQSLAVAVSGQDYFCLLTTPILAVSKLTNSRCTAPESECPLHRLCTALRVFSHTSGLSPCFTLPLARGREAQKLDTVS